MAPCEINQYSSPEKYCSDCLSPLGSFCKTCSKFAICDECTKGYYIGDVVIANITTQSCLNCYTLHTHCVDCNKQNCIKCEENWFLSNGTCYNCKSYPHSTECGINGASKCKNSYYLTRNDTGFGVCNKCMDALSNCLECSDSKTCTKCTYNYFHIRDG